MKTRFPTGMLPASKQVTKGGTVPGGMNARDSHVGDGFGHGLRHVRARIELQPDRGALPWIDLDSTCSIPVI